MPANRRVLLVAGALTFLIAVSRFFPQPPLRDAATDLPVFGVELRPPWPHLILTPFSTLADIAVCSSQSQAKAFLAMLAVFCLPLLKRGRRRWLLAFPAFLFWAILWPRAPARLEPADPDIVAVDFHSHTSHSWDGRRWYTPRRNLLWHQQAGFGAVFVTDHNRVDGALAASAVNEGAAGLIGQELSLHDAHVLLLGVETPVDPSQYPGLGGLRSFLLEAGPRYGGLAVMSLPEYYRHHSQRIEELAMWGASGFELVSASPKGLEVPPAFRRQVAQLCRARGLFVTGGTDNHGFGTTACVWSLIKVAGWRDMKPAALQAAVLSVLRSAGPQAVQVVARTRVLLQPPPGWRAWLDGPAALWEMMRSWSLAQCAAALGWVWGLAIVRLRQKR